MFIICIYVPGPKAPPQPPHMVYPSFCSPSTQSPPMASTLPHPAPPLPPFSYPHPSHPQGWASITMWGKGLQLNIENVGPGETRVGGSVGRDTNLA